MKKIIGTIIVVVTLLFMASCKKISDKTIISIGMWPESSLTADVNMFKEWKENFERDYPEYEIKGDPYTYSPETFKTKAENGDLPTVYQTWFTEPRGIVRDGHAKDITNIVKNLGWYDKLDPKLAEYLTFDERLYGIPRDGYGLGLVINLEIFEEAGLIDEDGLPIYPKTMQELRETAAYIKETLDVNGLIILNNNKNGGWQFSNIAWNFGAQLQVQDESGKWKSNLNSSEAISALQMIKDMYWTDDSLKKGTNNTYNDWHIDMAAGQVAMAIAGNDALSMVTTSGLSKDKIAFVPLPAGPNDYQYTLFGGTPFMFSNYATDKQVEGAIRFLEYIGRSPETSKASQDALLTGMQVAASKGMLILPDIKPWIDQEYLTLVSALEDQYVNVDLRYFNNFYENIKTTRRTEELYYTQEMYGVLDLAIQQIMSNQNLTPETVLNTANNSFQEYMKQLNG